MSTLQEVSQEEKADALLPLLVSCFPRDVRYTADAGKWANAILELKNTYAKTYPILFKNLHFRRPPKGDSYSSEVSNFLAFLQFADATEVHNPGFATMEFKENACNLLRKTYLHTLQSGELEAIQGMSSEIVDKLRIK